MFVKPAVLKKLMKQQYKTSGLVVANNGLVLCQDLAQVKMRNLSSS